MKLIVQAVHAGNGDPQDYSEFEALKESLAASVEDSGSPASRNVPANADIDTDDAYADFIRFVMKAERAVQPA
jgi:hypothetical protein